MYIHIYIYDLHVIIETSLLYGHDHNRYAEFRELEEGRSNLMYVCM